MQAIFIDVEGDEWLPEIDRTPDLARQCTLEPKAIIDKIAAAGIVGLGGACFPTHVKLLPPPGKKAEVLIVNGVECEPYLTCDHQLMLEHGEEIIIGIEILKKALGVDRAIIGIENNILLYSYSNLKSQIIDIRSRLRLDGIILLGGHELRIFHLQRRYLLPFFDLHLQWHQVFVTHAQRKAVDTDALVFRCQGYYRLLAV